MSVATENGNIPVFVLTGFLGAGKTSLLNALLGAGGLPRTGVIVNEYGEIGLDHLFMEAAGDSVIELPNGCLCCTNQGELDASLRQFTGRGVERIVIETSGLAEPAPILQALIGDPQITERFELAGVITLVDAVNIAEALEAHEEARQQVTFADALVITKTDLLAQDDCSRKLDTVRAALRELNPNAPILMRSEHDDVAALFRRHLWLAGNAEKVHAHHHHHHHDHAVTATLVRHDQPIARGAVEAFLELLVSAHGDQLLRVKGLVAIRESDQPLVVQGVRRLFHEPRVLERWPDADRSTRLVIISRGMEPDFIQRLFAGFADIALPDTPDRQALTDNPLAIPSGFTGR